MTTVCNPSDAILNFTSWSCNVGSMMTRIGCCRSLISGGTRRTVKVQSSSWTVERPTRTASETRRNRWTISNDSEHVKRSDFSLDISATPPCSSTANFSVTLLPEDDDGITVFAWSLSSCFRASLSPESESTSNAVRPNNLLYGDIASRNADRLFFTEEYRYRPETTDENDETARNACCCSSRNSRNTKRNTTTSLVGLIIILGTKNLS
mmetsp:Transcript_18215/g.44022  ORF Transcript_18215/g.44022 Transcript_18215/m.44022 type:complete len:209 (+) Transcript_18215:591-1217(+)